MTLHAFTDGWCHTCGCPDGTCTGVRSDRVDLHRILTEADDLTLERISVDVGVTYTPPVTVADVIRAETRIGYGGHFDETCDDEDEVYRIVARTDEELYAIHAARAEYVNLVRLQIDEVNWPAPGPLHCDRHGGTWGDDKTCPRCTYPDGRIRPPLDDPGPLGPGG